MFKKRKLGLALSAVMAGGLLASGTQAVTLTPDGLGDAALFQYYTANGNWQTFFRLINTSDKALAVKVRFREAANSREVLDFIVFMSPFDMWHAWTDKDALRNGGGPGIRTNDTSCVYPLPDTTNDPNEGWQTIDAAANLIGARFKNRAFTGIYSDNAAKSDLERMSEGHFEVIGIAQYDPFGNSSKERQFAEAVTHLDSTGKPANCAGAAGIFASGNASGDDMDNNIGANAYLINVAGGLGAGYDPTMLANFTDQSLEAEALQSDQTPDMDSAKPGPFGLPWNSPLANSTISQDMYAYNQTRYDGTVMNGGTITVTDYYRADIDGNGVLNGDNTGNLATNIGVDLNADGDCNDANEIVNENNIPPSQWALLENLWTDGAAGVGVCRTVSSANNPSQTKVQVNLIETITHDEIDPVARYKQIGAAGVWPVTGGVDAVSALLMRNSVINEWAAFSNPGGAISDNYTQWVINFPTKHYYVDLQNDADPTDDVSPTLVDPSADNDAWAPFGQEFDDGNEPGTSCEPYSMRIWNREEREVDWTSPAPNYPAALCYETNVVTFHSRYNTAGLNSNFAINVPEGLLPTNFDDTTATKGWARMQFTGLGTAVGLDHASFRFTPFDFDWGAYGHGHTGLPVHGFMLSVFNTNNTANNHAMINDHKYERNLDQVGP